MAGAVVVVTDSTAYLPDGVADQLGVTVVPLRVVLGGVSGAEGSEVTPADVAAALSRWVPVSTSRPTPADFVSAYRAALDSGASAVVSLHISSELSGTWESARLAAGECGGESVIRVVDSRSAAMGLGFAVLAAAEAAREGAGLEETYAAALLGTALSVKPILHVADGRIVPLEKVRTASKGVARLEALAAQAAGDGPVDVAVHHLATPDRAATLTDRLRARLPRLRTLYTSEVGAVVGAHVGPGLLGVVVVRR